MVTATAATPGTRKQFDWYSRDCENYMLKGISPLLGPDLLATLCRMGHGDELVLADAHFPGESAGPPVLRLDGVSIDPLLHAILPLFELDNFVDDAVVMMQVVEGDIADPTVGSGYRELLGRYVAKPPEIQFLDRFAFYERARQAFAVVMTGDVRKYANLILKKGVTPPATSG